MRCSASGTRRAAGLGETRSPRMADDARDSVSGNDSEDGPDNSSDAGDGFEIKGRDRGGGRPVQHPLYAGRYRVLTRLGAGAFSIVWLCVDEKETTKTTPKLVAMELCKPGESDTNEVHLLGRLAGAGVAADHVLWMYGHFWYDGPLGRHMCIISEVLGEDLLALIQFFEHKGLPMALVQRLTRHTLLCLEYIHSQGVLHTDVKPENVLLVRHDMADLLREAAVYASTSVSALGPAEPGSVRRDRADRRPAPPARQRKRFGSLAIDDVFAKLADIGNGCRTGWLRTPGSIQTRQYRSPEAIIEGGRSSDGSVVDQ